MRRVLALVFALAACSSSPDGSPAGTAPASPRETVPAGEIDVAQVSSAAFGFCLGGLDDAAARREMLADGTYNVDEVELVLANLGTFRRAGQCD